MSTEPVNTQEPKKGYFLEVKIVKTLWKIEIKEQLTFADVEIIYDKIWASP